MPPVEEEIVVAAPEPSLRDSLSEAFDAAVTPDPVEAKAPDPTPAERSAEEQRARDDKGRFAKPGEAPSPKLPEPTPPQVAAEPPGTIRIPPGLSAATKADFDKLPPHVQQDMIKWQGDLETAKTTWDQKAERFNRLDAVLGPRSERFRLAGMDEAQAVQALLAAQDFLERDPAGALLYLGRQSGVNWQTLFAQLQGQPQGQRPALPPEMQQLAGQVQTLTQTVQQRERADSERQNSEYRQHIEAFKADPKNIYFDNVLPRMSQLLASRQATNLPDAYEQACWADPQVRPLMIQAQTAERTAAVQAEAKAKAQAARYASGSITGSPTPGAKPGQGGPAPSLRDELSRQFDTFAP